jgi:hypothetical protein
MQDKQAKNGGQYTAITLKGQKKGFYDWDGHCARAEITAGDMIKIEHDGGEFPRVTNIEKVAAGESLETKEAKEQRCNGELEARMCALGCAALVLHGSRLPGEEITKLAEKLEKWITG